MKNVTVGISRVHNSSVCLLIDGEIIFHIENERLSNIKYDAFPFHALSKLTEYVDRIDNICLAGVGPTVPVENFSEYDVYTTFITNLNKNFHNQKIDVYDLWDQHHKLHAACAFYNSGFDDALCIIKDGMGSEYPLTGNMFIPNSYGRESFSAFHVSYPANFELVENHIVFPFDGIAQYDNTVVSNHLNEAMAFQITSKHFGFHVLDAGKVMGMAAHGVEDTNLPEVIDCYGRISRDLFVIDNNDLRSTRLNIEKFKYLDTENFQIRANFARKLQKSCEHIMINDVLRLLKKTGKKKLCLSGGFFLNCVANYELLNHLPDDIEIYIEPISSDAGTSIGAAKFIHHSKTSDNTFRKQNAIYYGLKHKNCRDDILSLIDNHYKTVSYADVAELLSRKKIVAMYQGCSESGPRALGNRSILYDPRDPNGKDTINQIKKREWFRPFACTILKQYVDDWFDMKSINESPYMMYAVDVMDNKKHLIPAILHMDDTCRIQTLDERTNPHYYNLIREFYKQTDIPMLFNTSFNLAGDCIVETVQDALKTLKQSKINYLYLPEYEIIIENNV